MKYFRGDMVVLWNENGTGIKKYKEFRFVPIDVLNDMDKFKVYRMCKDIFFMEEGNDTPYVSFRVKNDLFGERSISESFYRVSSVHIWERPWYNHVKNIFYTGYKFISKLWDIGQPKKY